MDKKTRLVIKGYLSLDPTQRKEIADAIRDHQKNGTLKEEADIKKTDIGMGPVGNPCPCCGR